MTNTADIDGARSDGILALGDAEQVAKHIL